MSLLTKYAAKEQELNRLKEELERLESDPRLKAELEFKDKLTALMREFDKSAKEVIQLLSPEPTSQPATASGRRKRRLKVYKNPNTGEVIETRGANHKTLKAWKDEHGAETVESWAIKTEE